MVTCVFAASFPAKKRAAHVVEWKKWPKEGADCKTMLDVSHSLIEREHYLGLSISHRNEMNRIAFYSKVYLK